ncbi:Arc family DNA-binding protein [Agrobacterium fabrum]|uniref:Arc family DNA-binding protein n=1 Tax=Agrobacterium fabrum TaxID=1176649 RepID=UPI001E43C297|nr:Arc family DNA-binding protein [Agrobacterium fabrum]
MSDRNPQSQDKYIVRMPDGMREELKNAATESGRSLNAEIVHRLQSLLPNGDDTKIVVDLEKNLGKQLLATAALHGTKPEKLLAGIVEDHFRGKSDNYSYTIEDPDDVILNHENLIRELDRLAVELESDFLLYTQKLTQLKLFASFIIFRNSNDVPPEVLQLAQEILETVRLEEEVSRRRGVEFISTVREEI